MRSRTGISFDRLGSGPPLLLIHGTGGSRRHWKPVVGLLARDHELLLVDLPGHARSGPPPEGTPHSPPGYAQLLSDLLDELGVRAPKVAGNSVGGWTALELAKLGRTGSVVALSPAGLWRTRDPLQCRLQLWGQYRLGLLFSGLVPPLLKTTVGRTALMSGTVARPRQLPPEEAIEMAQTYSSTPCFREHFRDTTRSRFTGGEGISVPVTIAWGDRDRLIPKRARRRDQLPDHARELTLPGCGHLPMWDDPALIARTIADVGASVPIRQVEP
jgi:pimeloyl-ACP methyl ester carboxylesterase